MYSTAVSDNSVATQNIDVATSNNTTSNSGIFIKNSSNANRNSIDYTNNYLHPHYDNTLNNASAHQNISKLRRDSIAHLQGMGGVSWGSLAIGSWLKDEVTFHATLKQSREHDTQHHNNNSRYVRRQSHVNQHGSSHLNSTSPPVAYSAYLPNLEKQYCKDYSCCGLSLPSLHDLLRHYEEAHISMSPGSATINGNLNPNQLSKGYPISQKKSSLPNHDKDLPAHDQPSPAIMSQPHQSIVQHHLNEAHQQSNAQAASKDSPMTSMPRKNSYVPQLHVNGNLIDAVSTNEVFLSPHASNIKNKHQSEINVKSDETLSGRSTSIVYPKMNSTVNPDMDLSFMDHDMMDSSYAANAHQQDPSFMGLSNNIITSSALHGTTSSNLFPTMAMASGHIQHSNGTLLPVHNDEEDDDNDDDDDDEDEDEDDELSGFSHQGSFSKNSQNNTDTQEGYIDDPARRLYVMDHEEHKPFKCPVVGCEKTYKNQNGLKYHKLHGHQNQKLHENADGTFSILDPDSNEPFPDGMGNEKDKPYRCEVCGKRYKNLNGLKYHRGHSTH